MVGLKAVHFMAENEVRKGYRNHPGWQDHNCERDGQGRPH
jgi:hypothetical protein